MESIIRQPDGTYEVLSSSGTYYYEVQMLSGQAISCQCKRFQRGHRACKHMEQAEAEEKKFQSAQQGFHLDAPLNGNAGFSLLKI